MKHILFKRNVRIYFEDGVPYKKIFQYKIGTELYFIYVSNKTKVPHREDGPAVIKDGILYWYYYGKLLDCKTQEEFEKLVKLKAFW